MFSYCPFLTFNPHAVPPVQFFAVVFGLIYLDLDKDGINGTTVTNISGILFVFITNMTFSNMFPVVTVSLLRYHL